MLDGFLLGRVGLFRLVHGGLEAVHGLTERLAQFRELPGAEDNQDHDQDNDEMRHAECAHGTPLLGMLSALSDFGA